MTEAPRWYCNVCHAQLSANFDETKRIVLEEAYAVQLYGSKGPIKSAILHKRPEAAPVHICRSCLDHLGEPTYEDI